MREMRMVYAVMVPRLFHGLGYVVHYRLFVDKSEAEHEAERLTKIARDRDESRPECYVKLFALVPREEEVENQEEEAKP